MAKRDRTSYWIDGQIQGALAIRIIFHWSIFVGIAAVLTFTMQFLGDPLIPLSTHFKNLWVNQGIFALVILILMPLFVYDTVRLSHRFAGPIVRLRRVLQAISNGQPAERLKFRDNDFWRGLASDFNSLIDKGHLVTNGSDPADAASVQPEIVQNTDDEVVSAS